MGRTKIKFKKKMEMESISRLVMSMVESWVNQGKGKVSINIKTVGEVSKTEIVFIPVDKITCGS